MERRAVMGSVAFVFMVLASVFLLWGNNPEEAETMSADGRVTITGVARATAPFTAVSVGPVEGSVLAGEAYRVDPSATALEEPVVLSFALPGLPVLPADAVVYRYDENVLMWEKALPIVAHTDALIAVEVRGLGVFAVGVREDVVVPNFVSVYEDLRESPPEGAVGYVIMTGYSREGEPVVRLADVGDQGGCGGAVLPGVREERSVVTRPAVLLVNDVETRVALTFLVRWFLRDSEACPPGLPFHSADDYGILPTS